MALEEIMKAVCCADKATLDKVAKVLRHCDGDGGGGDAEARLVTQGEAARRLGVSRTTVYRLVAEGRLTAVSCRGKRRVCLSSVLAFAGVGK